MSTKTRAPAKNRSVPPFNPHGARLLVQPLDADAMSPGGIILPQSATAQREVKKALVLAVGAGQRMPDGKVLPVTVKKGQLVYYPRYAGNEFEWQQQTYVILGEPDVLGVGTEE